MVYIHRHCTIFKLDLSVFFSPMNNPVIKHMCVHVYIERIVKAGGYRAVISLAPRVLVGRES